jgi:hypothetical protein
VRCQATVNVVKRLTGARGSASALFKKPGRIGGLQCLEKPEGRDPH